MILDEAQSCPEIFPRLRGAIDADRTRMGRFLLLGSISPALMEQVSESLAGRLSLFSLTPLLLPELKTNTSRARHWLCGGYPDGGVLQPGPTGSWTICHCCLSATSLTGDIPAICQDFSSTCRHSIPEIEWMKTKCLIACPPLHHDSGFSSIFHAFVNWSRPFYDKVSARSVRWFAYSPMLQCEN